jgi:two-component system cell cycle response regulator DivK
MGILHAIKKNDNLRCADMESEQVDTLTWNQMKDNGHSQTVDGRKVLIVDDNPDSRDLLRFALELQYVVEEAGNGQEAISRIRHTLPDLVLMDVQMPVMDGYEALREIRANPASATIPVIAITAFAMFEDRRTAFAAGFDGYLPKPINIVALRNLIALLLKHGDTS